MTEKDRNDTLEHMEKLLKHVQKIGETPYKKAEMFSISAHVNSLIEDFYNEEKIEKRDEEIEKILKDDETN